MKQVAELATHFMAPSERSSTPGHASGPILAGVLIARYDYLAAFLSMAALLIMAVPVFVLTVKAPSGAPNAS